MSIPETLIKIKGRGVVHLLAQGAAFALILGIFFMLGRISALASKQAVSESIEAILPPLVTTAVPSCQAGSRANQAQAQVGEPTPEPTLWTATASKTGKVYYLKTCPGISRVKPENRVYFASEQEAQQAGLLRAASCL